MDGEAYWVRYALDACGVDIHTWNTKQIGGWAWNMVRNWYELEHDEHALDALTPYELITWFMQEVESNGTDDINPTMAVWVSVYGMPTPYDMKLCDM